MEIYCKSTEKSQFSNGLDGGFSQEMGLQLLSYKDFLWARDSYFCRKNICVKPHAQKEIIFDK